MFPSELRAVNSQAIHTFQFQPSCTVAVTVAPVHSTLLPFEAPELHVMRLISYSVVAIGSAFLWA